MNLLIDIGNTDTTLYIETVHGEYRKYSLDSKEKDSLITSLDLITCENSFDNVIISSVVPVIGNLIETYLSNKNIMYLTFNYKYFSKFLDFGNLDYKNMGADRVVVDYASLDEYGQNLIIFDLGTAITVDVFKENKIINGYIFPGLRLMKESLIDGTSLLNTFSFNELNSKTMCLNTESQLNDGLIYGLIGVLNQYITVNKIHYQGDFKIIMTGGTIFQLIDYIGEDKLKNLLIDDVIFDRDLMYKGLSKINLTNRNGDL